MLSWGIYRSLENSLKYFLDTQISADAVTDINGAVVPVRIGRKNDNDWTLPCIAIYAESETSPRLEIGSNLTDDRFLLIIQIFATNEGERLDLARWLKEEIKNGFRYYTYSSNPLNYDSPTKVAGGLVSLNFLTNGRVNLGQNVDAFDAHRHMITINCWIAGG